MPTRFRGSVVETRALNTFVKLLRAAESLSARLHAPLASAGLTDGQFGVLEALHHLGPLCQKDLAEKLLRSGANLTLVIDNLEKRGLVRRERNTDDRRYITVHLTDSGRQLIVELFPQHVARLVQELRVLSPSEQDLLLQLCRKLGPVRPE